TNKFAAELVAMRSFSVLAASAKSPETEIAARAAKAAIWRADGDGHIWNFEDVKNISNFMSADVRLYTTLCQYGILLYAEKNRGCEQFVNNLPRAEKEE